MILHADSAGQGEPAVLLHGLFGRGRNLAGLARRLCATMRVVSLDLRNHGASPHQAGMGYPVMAQDVLDTLAHLGALPANFLGHSMGGKTAMACALLAPGSVRRLLVADIAPVAYSHANTAIAAAMQAIPLTQGMSRADASALLEPAVPDAAIRGFLLQNFVAGATPRWQIGLDFIAQALPDIENWPSFAQSPPYDGPTLFVRGGSSDYINAEGRVAARALFPQARFLTLKNAGHWLHADQPDAFIAAAAHFFGAAPGNMPAPAGEGLTD